MLLLLLHVAEQRYRRGRGTACMPSRGTRPNGAETSARTAARTVPTGTGNFSEWRTEMKGSLTILTYLYDELVPAVVGEAVGHNQPHVGDECIGPAVVPSVE